MEAGGGELTFGDACALLEERGYKRHEIRHLTPGYVNRVVFRARDEQGRLRFAEPAAAGREPWDVAAGRRLRKNGCPEHMIPTRLGELRSPPRP